MTLFLKKLYSFFPINLLALHFKKNHVLLLFWAFFFSAVSGLIGKSLGLHYLFLDPEYLGSANFFSYFIVGVCLGIFIISFFISSYIIDGHRYKFVLLEKYPFATYSLNNSPIPIFFLFFYLYKIYQFESKQGGLSNSAIFFQLLGLFLGVVILVALVIVYFSKTNRSALKDVIESIDKGLVKHKVSAGNKMERIMYSRNSRYRITNYLGPILKFKTVPKTLDIDKISLAKVFDQNHLNAVLLELILFVLIMSLGFYKDVDFLQIPAGASSFLFFSFALMVVGALFYWLRTWAVSVVIILFLGVNFVMEMGWVNAKYEAFGLNYENGNVSYNKAHIRELSSDENIERDKQKTLQILNNWRAKFGDQKPKMVIITSSGGGQRSAVWTTNVLQNIDKQLDKKLLKNTTLITGASGGIIGSSYYRELYLRDLSNKASLLDEKHLDNISKDILNPMVFSILVNDMLFRYQRFEYKGKTYSAGRGYAFENTLNDNVGGILNKSLGDYEKDEFSGKIPMVILAPTISNDSRKLFISTQRVSYLNKRLTDRQYLSRDRGVDFLSLFENQEPKDLRFLSALRMSATFPYITPNVHLPATPDLDIMDAGLSDNFGTGDALKYLNVFKDWINENTSGIIVIGIRDKEKDPEVVKSKPHNLIDKAFNPIDALYSNWDFVQDNSNDQLFELLASDFTVPLDQVLFEYIPSTKEMAKASLSWHLTATEKLSIKNNIWEPNNQAALKKVVGLLKP